MVAKSLSKVSISEDPSETLYNSEKISWSSVMFLHEVMFDTDKMYEWKSTEPESVTALSWIVILYGNTRSERVCTFLCRDISILSQAAYNLELTSESNQYPHGPRQNIISLIWTMCLSLANKIEIMAVYIICPQGLKMATATKSPSPKTGNFCINLQGQLILMFQQQWEVQTCCKNVAIFPLLHQN